MRAAEKLRDARGQMTVELCCVIPVVIIIAAIACNAMLFFSDCAKFDRLSRNAVRIYATSLPADTEAADMSDQIQSAVAENMENGDVTCEVSSGGGLGGSYTKFTLTYKEHPTLFGVDIRSSVFGVSMPYMQHSITLTVDAYSPGKWIDTILPG